MAKCIFQRLLRMLCCYKRVAERPSWCAVGSADKDRRAMASAWPTRATDLGVENQQLAILHGLHAQYAGSQETCNCYKEGTTKGERMRECVNV